MSLMENINLKRIGIISEIEQNNSDIIEQAYESNKRDYQIRKEYFQRNQKFILILA